MKNKIVLTNIEAFKLVLKQERWLIPIIILNSIFNNIAPYVTIYMSAQIVNEIAGAKNIKTLTILVLITIIANLTILLLGALLSKIKNYRWSCFENAEKQMFMMYGFTVDYEHLENTEMRQNRRKIDESKNINSFGIWSMVYSFQSITDNIINIILSIAFMSSLFKIIITESENIYGIIFYPIVAVALMVLSIYISMRNAKKLTKLGEDMSNNMIYVNKFSNAYGGYQMGKDIRIFNMLEIYEKLNQEMREAHINGSKKYWYGYRNTQFPDIIISQGINFTIYAFVCLNAIRGLFEIGSVIMYVGYISRLVEAFKGMSSNIAMFKMNYPFLRHYLDFFKVENIMNKGTLQVEKLDDNEYNIEFYNVSFKYPGSENYALQSLNLRLNNSKKLAVVGMNGSGKTTMIKLLCRLYDPTEGKITLNGIDIREYDYAEYMSLFSVVFQDFKLFSVSLGQNVAVNVNYDNEKVEESIKNAGFTERFAEMQKGLDTFLYKDFEEDGVEISGGEAQKIALSRALYKNAPFIVLDEPTAALDPIAEYEIYLRFNEFVGDKTAIYISHRLSSCRFCDDIAVFHEGKLIQRGNHDELIKEKNGKYYELWSAQAQYYTEQKKA